MPARDLQAAEFEALRDHLHAIAYRMLGSLADADDAVQTTWLRAERAGLDGVDNVAGWLTTVASRVCLDMLRARRRRSEIPLDAPGAVDPTTAVTAGDRRHTPEEAAVMADSVGHALLVVLDRLSPAQRVAFVLHDLFAVPFDDIATALERSTVAAKQLASRARRQVHGTATATATPAGRTEHHAIVEAFMTAARGGDIETLLGLLAPDVVRRVDRFVAPAGTPAEVRGARTVAEETRTFGSRARVAQVALVDRRPGLVVAPRGRLFAVVRVTVARGRITVLDFIADPVRLRQITLHVDRHALGGVGGRH